MKRCLSEKVALAGTVISLLLLPACSTNNPSSNAKGFNPDKCFSSVYIDESDSRIIHVDGCIKKETQKQFEKFTLSAKKIEKVVLNSTGGILSVAKEIGDIVRNLNMETYVKDYEICHSACTLIYQAGVKRIAEERAEFFYHTPKGIQTGNENPEIMRWMSDRMIEWGASPDFVFKIRGEGNFYNPKELLKPNIVQEIRTSQNPPTVTHI